MWPIDLAQPVWPPKYEPVLQHTDSRVISHKDEIADRILFKELTAQTCKFPSASLTFVFCMRPKLHLEISNLTAT
ncbi:hypothetical protein ACN38_g6454 [Penicillium nordicum]|uniref:Uncharacterized protein n=1 Tax=Penicillium nordicum TaxID=229535 RepID=A0A0M9WF96_9EURO|nr:hypothetical protein ACN38_g6454 [Penicillium nordicum]